MFHRLLHPLNRLPHAALALAVLGAAPASATTLDGYAATELGPTGFIVPGDAFIDQPFHYGIALGSFNVALPDELRDHHEEVPMGWRIQANDVGYVRFTQPWKYLIPEAIIFSPPGLAPELSTSGGAYGATWRPTSLGFILSSPPTPVSSWVEVAPRVTYLHIEGERIGGATNFFRIGVDATFEIEVPISRTLTASAGYSQHFYPPQPHGGSVFEVGPLRESIWTIGQPWVRIETRRPKRFRVRS